MAVIKEKIKKSAKQYKGKMKNKKIEGYWYSDDEYNKDYPKPIPNVLTEDEAKEIYQLIRKKQKDAHQNSYKGFSYSRISGERLGSREYEKDNWIWPVDFSSHYVLKHKVRPSEEFLEYIGFYDFIDISEL